MSYDRLQTEILAARDHREERVTSALQTAAGPLIFVSLNIPGTDKTPAGVYELFEFALDELRARLSPLQSLCEDNDVLGPLAVLATSGSDIEFIKRQCVELEQRKPVMRLLDLDVYADDGSRLGRREMGLPPRQCLLCNCPVTECIRLRRHTYKELVYHVHALLGGITD